MASEILIRPPVAKDLNFIHASFLKSMRFESSLGRGVSNRIFMPEFQKVIDHILDVSTILVACLPESHDTIIGYLIHDGDVLHYVLVKECFQRMGVASRLIRTAFPDSKSFVCSMNTKDAKAIIKNHSEFIFNPFVLYIKGV